MAKRYHMMMVIAMFSDALLTFSNVLFQGRSGARGVIGDNGPMGPDVSTAWFYHKHINVFHVFNCGLLFL